MKTTTTQKTLAWRLFSVWVVLTMLVPTALFVGRVPAAWAANTGWRSPTANAADYGGDGNGFERNPTNAYADGGGYAESRDNGVLLGDQTERHRYYNYGLNVPTGATIYGIEVRLDWWLDSTSDTNTMSVELSWDGGSSWTSAKTDSQETTSEHTVILGSTSDTWGRTWSPSDFSNANFRVRILNYSSNVWGSRDFRLDWVPVRVTYNRAPSVPALVSPANDAYVDDNTPLLDWNAATDPDGDTLTYAVSIDGGTYTDVGTATNYTTGVLAERQYTWQVRAYDGWTNGYSYSEVWNFTVDTDTPATPAYLNEGNPDQDYYSNTAYSLLINWGSAPDTGSGITYQLQRRVNGGGWAGRYNGGNTSFTDTATFNDNDFIEYQVRACTGAGICGGWRASDGIRIDSTNPATVTGVGEGDAVGADDDWDEDNSYYVFWNTVADTGSGISYQVQRSVNTGSWDDLTPTGLTCDASRCWGDDPMGHSDGDAIAYRVRAINGAGRTGSWSAVSDGVTLDLSAPDSSVDTGGVYNPVSWPGQIAGGASDGGSGVAQVHIRIYDADASAYWSGSDWSGTADSWVLASGATAWNYAFPGARLTDGHTYVVDSRATDVAGNPESSYGNNNFLYAAGAPEAPVPVSTTHPDPDTWYNNNQPSFEWDEPYSPIGVAGYSILLDQYAGTIPDKIQDTTQRTYDAATTPDGVWYFHVRAVDVTGQWGPAGHVRVQIDTTTPQAPTGVTEGNPDVDWDADGDIVVFWSAVPNTGSGISYRLERSVNGGPYTLVQTGLTGTSHNDNPGGYNDGDTVRYRVRATNGVGLSGGWRESDGMTIDSQTPAAPAWVYEDATAEPDRDYHNSANGAVTVRWATVTDTGSGITYRLEKQINAGVWTLVAQGLTGNVYADSGSYSDGDLIRYRVTAVNGVGTEGDPGNSDGFTIDINIPALPAWVREGVATDPDWDYDDDGSFTVYWAAVTDTGSGITYRLEKSVDDGAWQLVAEGIEATSRADSDTYVDGASIRYRVTPINGAGTAGPYRLSDGITIDLDAPQAPAWVRENDPDVDFDTDGAVWVNWAVVANTGSGITYDLQRRINGAAWTDRATDLAVTSFNDTDTHADETLIEYRVVAHNGVGRTSAATASDGVRVDTGVPATPTGVGEGDVVGVDDDFDQDNTFYVFWTGVAATATGDQIRYTVERNVNSSGWQVAVAGLTATSWDDPQAYSNGDQVAYRITAVNGAGTAGAVSVASDGLTVDTGRPNSTIDTAGYYSGVSWPDEIEGAASDDYSDVAQVEITIYDTDANLWWDGDSWESGGPYWLLTSGTANWTYALGEDDLTDGHNYDLQSRATDNAGNVETSYGTSSFIFASSGPQAPVVSSATHPDPGIWYNQNDPAFSWTTPGGPAPIVGYSFVLDQNAGTTPDAVVDTTGNNASYADVADGTWYFHVRALDNTSTWGPAGHYSIHIDTATPNAPATVTDESPDVDWDFDGSVTVHWTGVPDTGSGIVYSVERQIGVAAWTVLSDTVASTSFLDPSTGYADGAFIRYRVSARNGVNLTGPTTNSDGFTVDSDAPPTPAWVAENAPPPDDEDFDPDGSVRVYWAASTNTGSGLSYRLERRVTPEGGIPGGWTLVAEGLTGVSYNDPPLHSDGDRVEYRVTAVNGVGSFNPPAVSDGITIDTDTPAAPAEVTENSPDIDWSLDGSVTVFWGGVSDTGSGITYRLERQVNAAAWSLVADELPGGATSYPDSGAYNDGDLIRYRVRAANGAGAAGAWRESDGMTIDSSTPAAAGWVREENPDIDFDADGALTVYWAAVSDTGSGITYRLEKQVDAGAWTVIAQGLAGDSYYDGQTQPDGSVVHYRITAVNGVGTAGNAATSDGVTVDTGFPAAPAGLGEGDVVGNDDVFDQDNAFVVFWNGVADTGSGIAYDIEKSLNGGDWVAATSGVVGTSWDDPVPYSNGDTVQYRVRAVNGAGLEGPWSAASSGITLDFIAPDSAVTTHGYYNAFNWPGMILGASSDTGSDVAIVHITIQRASDSQYWNGTAWQAGPLWLAATGAINWQYTFAPADGETYDIRSRATDYADNVEVTYGVGSFTYSESGPQAPEISSPTHPDEGAWYDANSPTFNWTEPGSAAPVVGYSYVLDQNPGTTPDAVADTTARTVSYSGLADGVWYFHVRALDNANNWGPADHFGVHIDTATPAIPATITEESPDVDWDADGTLTVYWAAVPDTGSGITYRLERELNHSGVWTLVVTTPETSHADSGAYADGTFIRYRVRAQNGVGHLGGWVTSDGVTIDSDTPAAPAFVREGVATDPDWDWDADGSYTVYWGGVANTGSGIQYRLYRRVNGGAWQLLTTIPGTSFADSGAYPDHTLIEYQVVAVNGAGTASAPATSDGIRIDGDAPATPASVTEESPDVDWDYDGDVTVHWSGVPDTGSGITYRLERNLNGGGWTVITTQAGTTYADDIGTVDGAFAQYRVTAVNGVGAESAPRLSDGVTVDSQAVPQPGWVREDSATEPDRDFYPNADGAITVYWAGVADTGSGIRYRLERQVNGGAWTLVAANLIGANYPDSGAYADGDVIAYRVTAVNGVLTESASRVSDGMTIDIDVPAAPTAVGEGDAAGADDDFDENNVFYVFWTAPAETGSGLSYTVQRSRNGGAWEQATTGLLCAETPCRWDDPVPYSNGDTVQYRIVAVNGAGHSSEPSAASDGITLDFAQPDSAVSTAGYYNSFNWPGFIYGAASDSLSDVAYVDVTIQRGSDGQYWNGAGWQAAAAWLRATGTLNWQYAFAPADGETYSIRSRATDNATNVETTFGVGSFTYAASGPSAPEISSPTHPDEATWYNDDAPTFNWTTPPSGAGIQGYSYALDHNPASLPDNIIETNGNTVAFANLDDGIWYFHVRAQDGANNWGPADHFRVNIDTAAPAAPASITEESPDVDWDADGAVTVYWSAVTDTGSPITYRLERNLNGGGWQLLAGALATTQYADAGYANGDTVHYRVRAADEVGLTSAWTESDGVSFDLTTPPVPANVGEGDVAGADDDWDQDNDFVAFWNAVPGAPSGISYSVERSRNGGAWEEMITGVTATQWQDPTPYSSGENVAYRVTAHTGAGRSSAPSASSDGITLDFVRPDSVIETGGFYNNFTWPGYIHGTATDDLSDVAYVDITLRRQSDGQYWNGAAWVAAVTWLRAAGTANWQYTFAPADGETYDLQSRATDLADNIETTLGSSTFNYSSSGPGAPEISSPTHPDEAIWYNAASPTFNWTTPASGSGISGYSYVLDHAPDTEPDLFADTNGNTRGYTNLADGAWYFHVRALDNAGNWGPPDHFQVNIDTANPPAPAAVTEETPDVDWDADGVITVYWSAVADTSPVTYVLERSTNGGGVWAGVATGIVATDYLDPITHPDATTLLYRVRAVDAVGLLGPWTQSDGATVDSETPAQPAGLGEGDVVGADDAWDQDNTFYAFWNAAPNTGSGIVYTIERSVDGGAWETVQTDYAQTFWEDPLVFADGETMRYRITAINGVGTVSPVSAASSGITLDLTRPDSTVTTAGTYGPASWPGHIDGAADDATSGVDLVQITLQRSSDGHYWNGGAWVAGPVWLLTTGANTWTYVFAPEDGESYAVQSRATDAAGNLELDYGLGNFTYTLSEPDSTVTTSGLYVGAAWLGQIEGTAYAPMAALDFVDLTIQRVSDGHYFDGAAWAAAPVWLRASGTNPWAYVFTPADGETYTVRSRATDAVGNVEAAYGTGSLSYDAAAPVIQTVTVASNESYFYNPGLSAEGGSVYFDSQPGEGAGQTLTVTVTFDEPHPASLAAGTAFGDTPPLDTAAPWTASYSVEAYAGAQSDVHFVVADTLGLTDTASITFVEDNLPPASVASIAEEATNSAPIEIDWQASDNASGVYETHLWVKYQPIGAWTDTGLSMSGVSGSFLYTPTLGSGTYYFATLAVDHVGNAEAEPTAFGDDQVDFDDVPPSSSMDAPVYATTAPVNIIWSASDDAKYTYLYYRYGASGDWHDVDFSSARNGTFEFQPAQGDGYYYLATVAIDEAGNAEPIGANGKALTIYDTTPPASQASSPAEWGDFDFTVEWSGDDTAVGSGIAVFDVQVKIGDGDWSDWITQTAQTSAVYTAVYAGEPSATYHFRSRATDNAGHVEDWPEATDGDTTTLVHFPGSFPGKYQLFLPLVSRNHGGPQLPDLMVESVTVTPAQPTAGVPGWELSITVRNIGRASLPNGVWVDLYVDPLPERLPIEANESFYDLCTYGGVWWIGQLDPGESIVLTKADIPPAWLPFFPDPWTTPGDHTLYVQVDSIDERTSTPPAWARVYESNENNNVFGPVVVHVQGVGGNSTDAPAVPSEMPARHPPQ
ncbi:MAG: hypothetical protein ACOYZ7_04415 [Chloroflexota bacterium]